MKPREELNSIDRAAIHEAGHVAACIILELEFDTVYLEPSKDHPGLVSKLVKKADIDYSSGVLTPEEEVLSTNLVITAFAGPACDALHRGRVSFDFTEYEDLDEVLDTIEYRFPNNNVRIAFTHYCEAEAFALFEDDRRLWRFTHVLARELSKQKKLTYAQVTDLYSKEYLVESWVRKEVDEIRREDGAEKEGSLAASYEQRAASIEKGPKRQEARHKDQGARGKAQESRDHQGGRGEQKPPVQDREAPKHAPVVQGAPEGEPGEEGAAQQERRGRRRRRGRGRGRGKRRETLEQLPGEVIGGPAEETPGDKIQAPGKENQPPAREDAKQHKGGAVSAAPQATPDKAQALQDRPPVPAKEGQQRQPVPVQKAQPPRPEEKTAPGDQRPLQQLEPLPGEVINTKPPAGEQPQNVPAQGGEPPKPEERVRKQIIKAVKPPETGAVPAGGQPAAQGATPVVVPPAAGQRPAQQLPVKPPVAATPTAVPQEDQPATAEPPKRRLAVSGGPKAEGEAVSGGKGTTHPDSIWGEEKTPPAPKGEESRGKLQAGSEKPQAASSKPQAENDESKAAGGEGKKAVKAAKPRTVKAAKGQGPVANPPAKTPAPLVETPTPQRTKAARTAAPKAPAAQKKAPEEPKPAKSKTATKAATPRPVKAAKTAAKAAPPKAAAPEAPVKAARTAPAKKAAPTKGAAAPKKAAAGKNAAGKKK